jgi:hypothetical protein
MLVYGLSGTGKTLFASTAPNPGFASCETGHGSGLATAADKGIDFVEPTSYADFEAFCGGAIFKDKQTIVLDSLSHMTRTFIKDYALSIPRSRGDSPKRRLGIPELDDYGTIGEVTRRLLNKLLGRDQHLVVLATEHISMPDPETGKGDTIIGPDLPGALKLASTAMFDLVLRLRTRPKLRDPKDPKSRYQERYFITDADGIGTLAKCRYGHNGKSFLDKEEIIDLQIGAGTFPYLLKKITDGYLAATKGGETANGNHQ